MKLIKGLTLLSFLVIISGSCFDPPEFPVVPEIEFDRIEFIPAATPGADDSLILYINFKDGDGDLGFSGLDPDDGSYPYHSANFYQENNGEIEPLYTVAATTGTAEYDLLEIPEPEKGKLVFFRTRLKPGYSFLPSGELCPNATGAFKHYEKLGGPAEPGKPAEGRRMVIEAADRIALDPLVALVDSFPREAPAYYQIMDTLYYTPNEDHFNIEVDFLVKDPTAPDGFREFDWREEFCTTFDGRFPVFSDKPTSIDGSLRYAMTSLGFKALFSLKTLKLRVSIKDRERHRSNVIYTPEFRI